MFYVEVGATYENGCFDTRIGMYFKIPKSVVEIEPSYISTLWKGEQ